MKLVDGLEGSREFEIRSFEREDEVGCYILYDIVSFGGDGCNKR